MTESRPTAPIARLDGVVKRFGELTVLDGLDLSVAPGEKLVIIGRSGSGKSTVLRILMALEDIDAGVVEIDGEVLWSDTVGEGGKRRPSRAERKRLRALRSKVGMVFQHFHLFPHLTAVENVMLGPWRVLGLAREEARARAVEILDSVGLAEKADAYPAKLSGGQQQRVAIARALAMRPQLMLFDEVTSALDPELVGEVLEVMRKLARESDTTMILVTHQMHFAREIADRVMFVDRGKVVEEGPPAQVLGEPTDERTRSFLSAVLEV